MSSIALVIPSYGRPASLARALDSAAAQQRPFDQVVVASRADDAETHEVAEAHSVDLVLVDQPGVLAAMAAGVRATSADVVGFTDDDAELSPGWSERVLEILERPDHADVGGVGGRDVIYDGDRPRPTALTDRVGELTWWGRLIGNHHCGSANNRSVVVLKGANCAYRRRALALPNGLRGQGAQAHFEVAVGRHALDEGWRLLYFSDLRITHRPAIRLGEDQRGAPSEDAVADSAYNLMRGLPPGMQPRRWLYVHAVGDGAAPGILRLLVAAIARDRSTIARRGPAWRGTSEALRLRREALSFTTFE
jgi:glycosyltransferase involved in cell wall biosynthesis